MKTLPAAIVSLAILTGPAFAADPIMPAPAVPVVDSSSVWDGFYAGLNAGYGWGSMELESDFGQGPVILQVDPRGWLVGGQIGYNYNINDVVLGLEADYHWANILHAETEPGVGSSEFSINHFGTVRARIGADLDTYMPYLTGGLAFGELGSKAEPVAGPPESYNDWAWGFALGAGVEAVLADNITLKSEYLYVDLRGARLGPAGFQADVKAHAHTARIGLNYHF